MRVDLNPGNYVVAVSGGVDSMVLLDLLASKYNQRAGYYFTIAHFDHGIRSDSAVEKRLVEESAKSYGLPFISAEGKLGSRASEDTARKARYKFLHETKDSVGAESIITAHHQDDLLETAIINVLRGTSRLGLSSLRSRNNLLRPLLEVPKSLIYDYAKEHDIDWREDSTNLDEAFLRNYIRRNILSQFSQNDRRRLLDTIKDNQYLNSQINELLDSYGTRSASDSFDRAWFSGLPHIVAREFLATWLRKQGVADFDKKSLERLVAASKTLKPGRQADVTGGYVLKISKKTIQLSKKTKTKPPK